MASESIGTYKSKGVEIRQVEGSYEGYLLSFLHACS